MLGINHYLTTRVLTDPECVDQTAQKKAKTKTKMGLKESAQFLASSKYIRRHLHLRHDYLRVPATAPVTHYLPALPTGTSACWPRW